MIFGGRWVSLEFANILFSFWMVEVVVLVAFACWLTKRSRGKPSKGKVGTRRLGKPARRAKQKQARRKS